MSSFVEIGGILLSVLEDNGWYRCCVFCFGGLFLSVCFEIPYSMGLGYVWVGGCLDVRVLVYFIIFIFIFIF
jgi:hypothetical protein